MTKRQTLMTTACFATLSAGALYGQTGEKTTSFQYFVTNDTTAGNINVRVEGMQARPAVGRPLSATEERETVQVLGDGTRIDKKETDKYYRDAQGRTRIERDNGATIIISDPVTGFTAEMSTTARTARKIMVQGAPNGVMIEKLRAEMASGKGVAGTAGVLAQGPNIKVMHAATTAIEDRMGMKLAAQPAPEDLGTQIVNGVPAQGTRSVIVIPVGQIGNDREIRVVSERWFSADLQMLVKSSNNDPRFGETTYQMINVIQGAQDPSLFQIPADFSVNGLR